MNHPAHVHLFKNLIWRMREDGHQFLIVSREKDKTIDLLDRYGFEHIMIGRAETTPMGYVHETLIRIRRFLSLIQDFQPDIVFSQMDPSPAAAAKLKGVPYVCLADSEPAKLILKSTLPLSRKVLTPSSFRINLGRKQIRYDGYKELAYLHPNVFKPDATVLNDLGLRTNEPYFVLRFVSWAAHHDVGERGIQNKLEMVKRMEEYGRVLISSEAPLDRGLERYALRISPEMIHHVLYFAHLLVCDSQTMATEAGVLGTPVVRCNSFVGGKDMGNFIELENKYHLIFNCNNEKMALDKAISLLETPNLKEEWIKRRNKMLKDKIDLTAFLVKFIEDFHRNNK